MSKVYLKLYDNENAYKYAL